jgi:hypothetical protein
LNKTLNQRKKFVFKSGDSNHTILEYLQAFEDNDLQTMRKLESEHPALFADQGFMVLKSALNLP